jgi:hypothetical protein
MAVLFCLLWALDAGAAANEKVKDAKQSHSFAQPIRPAGQSAAGDTQALQAILDAGKEKLKSVQGNAKQKQQAHQEAVETEIARLEQFVDERPASVWSPSLRVNLGRHYRQKGRYSEALRHWEEAWQATKHLKDGEGKMIADEALAHWTRILASLGRFETLAEVLNETKGRVLDRGPLSQMFSRTQEGYAGMIKRSGQAYKCGVYALHNVMTVLKGRAYDAPGLTREPSTKMGFTIEALSQLSERYRLGLVAVKRERGDELVVPSVVHWRQNHYAAIVGQKDGLYQVVDPTFEHTLYMSAETINAEASGWFLVPAQQRPAGWRQPPAQEQREVFGRGYPYILKDQEDRPCLTGCPPGCPPGMSGASCQGCDNPVRKGPGMPWWQVSEPYLNLWLHDSPLGYQPAFGPAVSFDLSFKQRDEAAGGLWNYSSVGYGWNCSWLSYVAVGPSAIYHTTEVDLFLPGGGVSNFRFTNGVAIDYISNLRLVYITDGGGTVTSYELLFPDGSKLVYGFPRFNSSGTAYHFFLSQKVDPQGKALTFE